MIALIDTIERTEEFLPRKSRLCSWCPYQELCPKQAQSVGLIKKQQIEKVSHPQTE
jgi:RecB family exonuclease